METSGAPQVFLDSKISLERWAAQLNLISLLQTLQCKTSELMSITITGVNIPHFIMKPMVLLVRNCILSICTHCAKTGI